MTTSGEAFTALPNPGQANSVADLVERLRLLKVWAGCPSYETIKERVNAAWTSAGRNISRSAAGRSGALRQGVDADHRGQPTHQRAVVNGDVGGVVVIRHDADRLGHPIIVSDDATGGCAVRFAALIWTRCGAADRVDVRTRDMLPVGAA
jgi:hypothetical protein